MPAGGILSVMACKAQFTDLADESYRKYADFVVKTYGIEPAPMSLWIRVNYRGIQSCSGLQELSEKLWREK